MKQGLAKLDTSEGDSTRRLSVLSSKLFVDRAAERVHLASVHLSGIISPKAVFRTHAARSLTNAKFMHACLGRIQVGYVRYHGLCTHRHTCLRLDLHAESGL